MAEIRALCTDLLRRALDGNLVAPVENLYAIDDIKAVLALGGRVGKNRIAANG
jgi:hypothetical protein